MIDKMMRTTSKKLAIYEYGDAQTKQTSINPKAKTINTPSSGKNNLQKLKAIKAKVLALDAVYKDFGKLTLLFGTSKYYQKFTAQHLMVHAFLPLKLKQYKIYHKNLKPFAFVSWAFLSDEVQEKFQNGDYILSESEFNCGDNIWLTEFVTPNDDERDDHQDRNAIIRDLKENIFFGKNMKAIVRNMDGTVKRIASV